MKSDFDSSSNAALFVDDSVVPRVARWRWWAHLLIIGFAPLLTFLSARHSSGAAPQLPGSVSGLLVSSALNLAVFAVFWFAAWGFSRFRREEVWLSAFRARDIAWGAFYSLALRLALGLILAIGLAVVAAFAGLSGEQITRWFQQNGPQTESLLRSISVNQDPLYRVVLLIVIPFIVAGAREELWRAATMAGWLHVLPARWSMKWKNGFAVVFSSIVFGLGHAYQGPTGVVVTGILGAGLALVTLHHRSLWPAIWAHGFIDFSTFILAPLAQQMQDQIKP